MKVPRTTGKKKDRTKERNNNNYEETHEKSAQGILSTTNGFMHKQMANSKHYQNKSYLSSLKSWSVGLHSKNLFSYILLWFQC